MLKRATVLLPIRHLSPFLAASIIGLLAPVATAQLPTPLSTPLPTCAETYLYSVGNLHYYRTVDCDDGSTGFGTSSVYVTPAQACDETGCISILTTPVIMQLLRQLKEDGSSDGLSDEELEQLLVNAFCRLRNNPYRVRAGSRGERALVKRRIQRLRLEPEDPRFEYVEDLLTVTSGEDKIDAWCRYLRDGNDDEQTLARKYLDQMGSILASIHVSVGGMKKLVMPDIDQQVGYLDNLVDDESREKTVEELKQGKVSLPGWEVADAIAVRKNSEVTGHYVKIAVASEDYFFRLQTVTGTETGFTHHVGQQVHVSEVPQGANVISGAPNVKLLQQGSFAHVLKVRNARTGSLNAHHDAYLVYSAESLK